MISFDYRSEISFNLPMHFPLAFFPELMPYQKPFTEEEKVFFENRFVTKDEAISIEKESTKQAICNK